MSEGIRNRSRVQIKARSLDAFELVKELGCRLPDVEAATKFDGSPVLKVHGVFLAGLAVHPSAEPETLVVRVEFDEREGLLEDAPETYYVTDHYRRHPVVLVRPSLLKREVLSELLAGSWRMAAAKHSIDRATPTKMSFRQKDGAGVQGENAAAQQSAACKRGQVRLRGTCHWEPATGSAASALWPTEPAQANSARPRSFQRIRPIISP